LNVDQKPTVVAIVTLQEFDTRQLHDVQLFSMTMTTKISAVKCCKW